MLSDLLTVLLAVLNVGVAAYVLINARRMFTSKPVWVNELFEDADNWLEDKIKVMLTPDPESGMNFVDALAARFGKGFRMSLLAQKSGEARHEKMIEGRVFEAVKANSPEIQLGVTALDKLGLGDLVTAENMPALLKVAQKYGVFDNFLGSRGSETPNSRPKGVDDIFKVR